MTPAKIRLRSLRKDPLRELTRILTSGLSRPNDARRYLAHSLFSRPSPVELGMPWFAYGAIDFLSRWVKPDMTVYEYGCGGSTIFFAQRVKSVVSVEQNELWQKRVMEVLQTSGLTNAKILTGSFDTAAGSKFETSEFARALPSERADIVVVDSSDSDVWPARPRRPQLFRLAAHLVRPGGIVVLDDSWRYPEVREWHPQFRSFSGLGPSRVQTTSTDVFFF